MIHQREGEIADLDRLVNEYRVQIRALADKCASMESAAPQGDRPPPPASGARRRRPMSASNWTSPNTGEFPPQPPDHPLAGLEAKAAQELLNWQRTKNGGPRKPD